MPDQDADRSDPLRAASRPDSGSGSPAGPGPDSRPAPEPRFALGELVMVRSAIDPSRNVDCTRVIDRQWYEGRADWGWYAGWQYIVARHVDAWAVEGSLRPRPEPGALGWQALKRTFGDATEGGSDRPKRTPPVRTARGRTVPTDA